MNLYKEIEEHFEKEYPREACGVLSVVKGQKQCFQLKTLRRIKTIL